MIRLVSPARSVGLCFLLVLGGLSLPTARLAALTVNPPDFEHLVNDSEFVVRTVVKSVRTEKQVVNGGPRIFTLVELEVREVVVGQPPQPLVLKFLGGSFGGDTMVVEGVPTFQVGQEDILFIRGNGRQFAPLTAVTHGRYPIVKEAATTRSYMLRNDRTPLADVGDVARPLARPGSGTIQPLAAAEALTPEAFISKIRAAYKQPTPQARAK